jgi:hypothetical protein
MMAQAGGAGAIPPPPPPPEGAGAGKGGSAKDKLEARLGNIESMLNKVLGYISAKTGEPLEIPQTGAGPEGIPPEVAPTGATVTASYNPMGKMGAGVDKEAKDKQNEELTSAVESSVKSMVEILNKLKGK